jgi:kynurenine formamidase
LLHHTGTHAAAPQYFNQDAIAVLGVGVAVHNIHGYASFVRAATKGKNKGNETTEKDLDNIQHIQTTSQGGTYAHLGRHERPHPNSKHIAQRN